MTLKFKGISIKNFKSLHELNVRMQDFNVIVGKNASGKTNFIEFFKFLKELLVKKERPLMPFIEWWGFENIVWNRDEKLPIQVVLDFDVDGVKCEYELAISGIGGKLEILREKIVIIRTVEIEKEGRILRIRHDKEFFDKNSKSINQLVKVFRKLLNRHNKKDRKYDPSSYLEQEALIDSNLNLINLLSSTSSFFPEGGIISNLIPLPLKKGKRDFLTVFSELREKPVGPPPGRDSLLDYIVNQFNEAIDKITILSHPNIKLTKAPNLPRKEEILIEDGSNLNSVLYNWFLAHNKLPERIETALFQLFPETQIRFQLTTDGKVYIQLLEKGLKLPPPCIADGFYKILIVLLALESNPSLILIDELENSLYAEALQYVIDELKNSRTTVIITTHSPVVVDMVDLNDLLIAERTINGTQFKKIRNVQKMRKRLAELKITPSESWLSGVFYDDKTADFK